MEKVLVNGLWLKVQPIKNRLGAFVYKGKKYNICFRFEGYYGETERGKQISIQEIA